MRNQSELLDRITAAGDTAETILREYPALEPEDIQACLRFAHRSVAGEHVYDRLSVREAS